MSEDTYVTLDGEPVGFIKREVIEEYEKIGAKIFNDEIFARTAIAVQVFEDWTSPGVWEHYSYAENMKAARSIICEGIKDKRLLTLGKKDARFRIVYEKTEAVEYVVG